MVKRARTLRSLDDLNLSAGARIYLERGFDCIDDVVKYGRAVAYKDDGSMTLLKWKLELVSALQEAGFIRSKADFAKSFCVGALYQVVFNDYEGSFVTQIEQLSSEQYERFVSVADEDVEAVKEALRSRLSERECDIMCYRFGLNDGNMKDYAAVGRYFNVTRGCVCQAEERALRKLREYNALPTLFDAPEGLETKIDGLKNELAELQKNPVFQKERELLATLERMKRMPFRRRGEEEFPDPSHLPEHAPIEELDLKTLTYNRLKQARFNTIFDILEYPKDEWHRVRGFGAIGARELVEKMRAAGYEDFDIEL